MKITNNMDIEKQLERINKNDFTQRSQVEKEVVKNDDKVVEVSLSEENNRRVVLSDEELQCAIENVLASQSGIFDVDMAEEMINKANMKINQNPAEAILAQANQTPPVVAELTK